MDVNGREFDAVLSSLLRAQAVLLEVGSAMELSNPGSDVAKRIIWEASVARTAAYEAITFQQSSAATP